jgi:hypothetical protein
VTREEAEREVIDAAVSWVVNWALCQGPDPEYHLGQKAEREQRLVDAVAAYDMTFGLEEASHA